MGPPFTSLSSDEASVTKCLDSGHKPDTNLQRNVMHKVRSEKLPLDYLVSRMDFAVGHLLGCCTTEPGLAWDTWCYRNEIDLLIDMTNTNISFPRVTCHTKAYKNHLYE